MSRSKEIQICEWIHVDPLSVRPMPGMSIDQRFATVAVLGDRVVGVWSYGVARRRGRIVIDSAYTEVAAKHRRDGLATKLWLAGIERWRPDVVRAQIATWRGARFLAAMTVRLAGVGPRIAVRSESYLVRYDDAVRALALEALAATRKPATAKLRAVP